NAAADLPVWRVARRALTAGAPTRVVRRLATEVPSTITLRAREFTIVPYLLGLRPHQWLKNALLAVPAMAGHDLRLSTMLTVLIAFVSFSLGASSIYLVNDMLDLPHDRIHPEKRHRPLAAGAIPLSHAVVLLGVVSALSFALALLLPWAFM